MCTSRQAKLITFVLCKGCFSGRRAILEGLPSPLDREIGLAAVTAAERFPSKWSSKLMQMAAVQPAFPDGARTARRVIGFAPGTASFPLARPDEYDQR